MIWQLLYAEMVFSPKMWPDFSTEDLEECLRVYGKETADLDQKARLLNVQRLEAIP